MNRINEKGITLIQYKDELLKDYPKIVKDSLELAVQQLLENQVIDLDTFEAIKEKDLSIDKFQEYLLTKPAFSKTDEEILQEFEVVRAKFNEQLKEAGLEELETESIIEKDVIQVNKKFKIEESFVMDYFGVQEVELLKLMKRRGFIEKFSILRLPRILKDILDRVSPTMNLFEISASPNYFDKLLEIYCIDLVFEINVEEIDKGDKVKDMIDRIALIKKEAEEIYAKKTVI